MKRVKLFVYSLILGVSFFVYQEKVYASGSIPISSVDDLIGITDMSQDYELMNDIDLSTLTVSPFVDFRGDFDGNGYTLSNYHVTLNTDHSVQDIGLFMSTNGAHIHDLKIDGFRVSVAESSIVQANIGLLVGSATDTNFSNIIIDRSSIETDGINYVGGMIGILNSTVSINVSNIHVDVEIYGGSHLGGLIGAIFATDLTLSNVSTKGIYTNIDNMGGFFGDSFLDSLTISNSTSNARLIGLQDNLSNYVFNGFSAQALIGTLNLDKVLIQTSFENQTGSSVFGNALMDMSNVTTSSITNSYYIDGLGFSSNVLSPLSASNALIQSSYVNYDFVDTWVIHPLFNDGIPYLRYPLKTITYDSNGGSAVGAQPYFPFEGSTAPSDPSLSGYTFNGWTLNGSAFDFSSTSYGTDLSLLANYTLIPVTSSTTTTVSSTPLVSQPEPIPQTGRMSHAYLVLSVGIILVMIERWMRD